MTGVVLVAVLAAIGLFLIRLGEKPSGQYTQIACATCDGAGWDVKTVRMGFLWLRRRRVRRPCRDCGGSPWAER